MYAFDDNAAVLSVLERLAGREEPLTQLMARQAGAREARWVHLLSGPVSDVAVASVIAPMEGGGSMAQRVAALEEVVRGLGERLKAVESKDAGDGGE